MILISNLISMVCISFLVFVPWKRGSKCWTSVSPYIFYVVLLMNYLIIPFANIFVSFFLFCNPHWDLKAQTAETYVLFFFGTCCMRIFEFFANIKRTVLLDARTYLSSIKELEEYKPEDLVDEFDKLMAKAEEDNEKRYRAESIKKIMGSHETYIELDRGYGQGDPRLG